VIDLQSMGGTTLTITEADILALSKTTDIVTIRGDAGDTVIMEGAAKSHKPIPKPIPERPIRSTPWVMTGRRFIWTKTLL